MKALKSIIIIFGLIFLFVSCCKKPIVKKQEPVPAQKQEQTSNTQEKTAPVEPKVEPIKPEPVVSIPMIHKVKKGECLWIISSYKDIYNDPFMWPLIYKANKDKIKDPDLIFPGQIFNIDRDYSEVAKTDAIKFAKNRGKWSLWDGK